MRRIRPNVFTFDTTADLTPYFQQGEAWVGVWTDSETYSYVAGSGAKQPVIPIHSSH
jgi:putative spermidine/putrescine transport system substrate-binding protein